MLLKGLHGQNLHADIDQIAHEKRHVLDEEVVSHKSVLTKLYLDRDPLLDKVCLVPRAEGTDTGRAHFLALSIRRHVHRPADQPGIVRNPITRSPLAPAEHL